MSEIDTNGMAYSRGARLLIQLADKACRGGKRKNPQVFNEYADKHK
jgi:hypothetical protein